MRRNKELEDQVTGKTLIKIPATIKPGKWGKFNELSLKQLLFTRLYIKYKNAYRAAKETWSCKNDMYAYAMGQQALKKLPIRREILYWLDKAGLGENEIVENLRELTKATKLHSSHTEPDREVPDNQSRLKANELILKLKDSFPRVGREGSMAGNKFNIQIISHIPREKKRGSEIIDMERKEIKEEPEMLGA